MEEVSDYQFIGGFLVQGIVVDDIPISDGGFDYRPLNLRPAAGVVA